MLEVGVYIKTKKHFKGLILRPATETLESIRVHTNNEEDRAILI